MTDAGIEFLFELAREKQIDAPSMVNLCDAAVTIAQTESEEKPLSTALIVGDPVRILVTQLQAIEATGALCQSQFADWCYAETYYCPDGTIESMCISAPGADKGTALRLVLDRLGIGAEQAMAIGDHPNDLPMFACAGTSIAMGNATDEVKRQATVIAPSNDKEGVAWALQSFVFPRKKPPNGA